MKELSRKASWVVALAVALLMVSQQHAVNTARINERAADEQLQRAMLEIAALRSANYVMPQIGAGMKEVK